MSIIESMQKRYTTKKYDAKKKLDSSQIADLQEILRLSPSSLNSQPWHFHFVRDEKIKAALAEASLFNAEKILKCDTLVAFSAINDMNLFEQQINKSLPEGAVGYFNAHLKPLPDNIVQSWFEKQVYLALGVFLTACAQMNIDATPMEGIESGKYNTILNNQGYNCIVAVAIGYRDEADANQIDKKPKARLPQGEVVTVV